MVFEVDCDDWKGGEGYIDVKFLFSIFFFLEEFSYRVVVCGGFCMVLGVF